MTSAEEHHAVFGFYIQQLRIFQANDAHETILPKIMRQIKKTGGGVPVSFRFNSFEREKKILLSIIIVYPEDAVLNINSDKILPG